tara:strand:- start:2832 stop:3077 length:246 start_codon:yes stop_codon:yes gene_type:complete
MPSKKELQEKIKKLEEEKKILEEQLETVCEVGQGLHKFIRLVNLEDLLHSSMKTGKLELGEVIKAVKSVCPKCAEGNCEDC